MELKYPRAIRGRIRDIVRIGIIGNDSEEGQILMDIEALPTPFDWALMVHTFAVHVATALAEVGIEDPDTESPLSRDDMLAIIAQLFNEMLSESHTQDEARRLASAVDAAETSKG